MKLVTIIVLSVLVGGCDMVTLLSNVKDLPIAEALPDPISDPIPPPAPPAPPTSDFIAISGERYEKYYFTIDPATWDKQTSISGSFKPTLSTTNSITFNNVPLRYFFVNGTYSVRGTGTAWVHNTLQGTLLIDINFNTTRNMSFEGEAFYSSTIRQDYNVLKTFDNQSFVLPKTSDYQNSYHESKYITLSYSCPVDQFNEFVKPDMKSYMEFISYPRPDPIPMAATIFEPFVCVSRNFYQYKSLVVQFDPSLVIHYVFPTLPTVVSTLDLSEENVLTVTFAEYNEPFEGPIFSYIIQYADGTSDIKTFSIE